MEKKHHKYFVGHKKPAFRMWNGFLFYEQTNKTAATPWFGSNSANHRVFNEYSALFALRRTLEDTSEPSDLVTIGQYRRFVLNSKFGYPSKNMPWCNVLRLHELENLNISNEYLPRPGHSFLLGSIVKLPSIQDQYAKVHFLRDILRFTSCLIDLEILTNHDAHNFLNQEYFIPSPSCGTFTSHHFIQLFKVLELAAKGFWNDGFKLYDDPYQSRSMSFLLERLNSFLLISYLKQNSLLLNDLIGFTTMVVSDDAKELDVQRGLIQ